MASLPIGSDTIVGIYTEKANIIIKSNRWQGFSGGRRACSTSTLEVCSYALRQVAVPGEKTVFLADAPGVSSLCLSVHPLFFEQTDYEVIIQGLSDENVGFCYGAGLIRKHFRSEGNRLVALINCDGGAGYVNMTIDISGEKYASIRAEVVPVPLGHRENGGEADDGIYSVADDSLQNTYYPSVAVTGSDAVDWHVQDVLVGSFRNEEQFRINYRRRFYHTAVKNIVPSQLPVRYVAMCRQKTWENPGIQYYGEVTETRIVKRRDIPVPTKRNSAEEPYFLFSIRRWEALPAAIAIKEEGVYVPRSTNLFLLRNCRRSFELFCIRSEAEYRLLCALRQLEKGTAGTGKPNDPPMIVRVDEDHILCLQNGYAVLCNGTGETISQVRAADLASFPGRCLTLLLDAFRRHCTVPDPNTGIIPR